MIFVLNFYLANDVFNTFRLTDDIICHGWQDLVAHRVLINEVEKSPVLRKRHMYINNATSK